ncbi:MAG: (2Fe-2S)-binding protein [Desulfobacterales bacterium]|nr:(2Fe-2S)-binding protein [Desulfobacterales bacterium]
MAKIIVNDIEINALEGENLLKVCLENDIYIPNLCYIKDMDIPSASCRICFVEMLDEKKIVSACTTQIKDGMVLRTDTEAVISLQKAGFKLLLSLHKVDCKNCPANRKCELQKIAKYLKVGLAQKETEKYLKPIDIDTAHPFIEYYPNRCILCGKCIYKCIEKNGKSNLAFAKRGFDTVITFYGEINCNTCNECINICPVSALCFKKKESFFA